MTAVRARLMRRLLGTSCALAVAATALMTGCSTKSNVAYGTAVVTVNAVSGDFSSYIVNIDSITLTRSDGFSWPVLGTSTPETVDLVKLHDLTELVEAPAVPAGTYTTLTLALDYTYAAIRVDVNGVPMAVTPQGTTSGSAAGGILTVTFDPKNPLVISAGGSTRLAIDINVAASNTINLSASPPTVTVQPFMTATVSPVDQTVMRARGIFVIAEPGSSNYVVNMRPFNEVTSALGALTVNTTSSTYFNVDGTVYTGAAGLAAMQKLLVSTPIEAYGTLGSLAAITPTFNATAVYAGTSLESPLAEYLTGTVSAVSSNTLNLHGATCVSRLGGTLPSPYIYPTAAYFTDVPVTVGSATLVTEDGVAASALTPQAISVGQLITVAGQASTQPLCGGTASLTLDATQGLVRLRPTPVWGTLNSAVAGSLSLNVLALGNFEPGALTFAGTGSAAANDAVAASYAVNTPGIDESSTAAGTLLEAVGFVAPFGTAPPDFTASSVTPGGATPQTLVVEWENGGATQPFSTSGSSGLVVDLSNANLSGTIRYIATGPSKTDLTTLPASPTIGFATSGTLTLAVGPQTVNSVPTIEVFNSASDFATALASALNGTNKVYRLVCVGQYSSATNTFTATQVAVNL